MQWIKEKSFLFLLFEIRVLFFRSRDSVDAVNPGNNLYVTGLSTRVTSSELEDFFNKEGKVPNSLELLILYAFLSLFFASSCYYTTRYSICG